MKTAVIAAMEPELKKLTARLSEKKTTVRAGVEFHEGTLNGHPLVLLRSGIGKVNAAMGTALLLEIYEPDAVINTGVAGALDPSLKPGSIVLSSRVCHHDVDASPFGWALGQVPGMDRFFLADKTLLKAALFAAGTNLPSGLIVSGDSFIGKRLAQSILKNFPDALAGEMEAAAIAQTCAQFKVPWLIIRAISDIAGEGGNEDQFKESLKEAATNSADLTIKLIQTMEEQTHGKN